MPLDEGVYYLGRECALGDDVAYYWVTLALPGGYRRFDPCCG
jgi:hypothetical protein